MNRDDVLSFHVNFTIPPNIIREYFDGLAKVESSTDYSLVNKILTPIVLSYIGSKIDVDKIVKDKKVSKNDIKNKDEDNTYSVSSMVKDVFSQIVLELGYEAKTNGAKTDEVKTNVAKTDEAKTDEAKNDETKNDEDETCKSKTGEAKIDKYETDESKTEEVKTDEVKTDGVKTDFTDCYEELAHLLNTDKRASVLLLKIKQDGNIFKLMQIINNTNPQDSNNTTNNNNPQDSNNTKDNNKPPNSNNTTDNNKTPDSNSTTDNKKSNTNNTTDNKNTDTNNVTDDKNAGEKVVISEVQPNPLAGLAGIFSGGPQGLNEMMAGLMKSTGQQNNPAVDNMMKSFGPVMEGLMGGNFANNPSTTTTTTTAQKKTKKQKTTQEILEELEKNDDVD